MKQNLVGTNAMIIIGNRQVGKTTMAKLYARTYPWVAIVDMPHDLTPYWIKSIIDSHAQVIFCCDTIADAEKYFII